ncbi:MAG TPA: polyketide synthase, partial [Polyangiaceae bacterium]
MSVPAIAVTGIAVRLSGASSIDGFWDNVTSDRDPFAPLPSARFDPEIFVNDLPARKLRDVLGALVDDFELDWRALRLPPAQVKHLHRVERLTLAVMGDALTDSGHRPRSGPLDKGGIWMAANSFGPDPWLDPMARIRRFELAAPLHASLEVIAPARAAEIGDVIDRVSDLAAPPLEPDVLMISACIAAGRASQIYDLRGGHLAIDAGMCSSMAAIHQATRALQMGECDMALVCATAPLVTPSNVLAFAHRGELGHERPRPFAPNAAGTILGDGAVAVVLERHDDVGRKRVYAVIEGLGYAVSPQDRTDAGLERCVAEAAGHALAQARLHAQDVSFIESRAAGVAAADRAEAEGLARAYKRSTAVEPAHLTSTVSNVGFLQAASGLLALVKASLAIHRRYWPGQSATIASIEPVAGIRVPHAADSWVGARRAAVSDAGPGGIAYHAILADP